MAAAEVGDGAVMCMMSKRLRALRKKYNRILQMEEAVAQGRSLNREQEETLRSKPAVAALIEEYEKLRQPLSAALQEELSLARHSSSSSAASAAEGEEGENQVRQHQGEAAATAAAATGEAEEGSSEVRGDSYAVVEDLLKLLYFGCLFDMRPQSEFASMVFTRAHERQCCLTYDYVTDDSTGFLGEDDLDLISSLGGLMTSRPPHSGVSHVNALLGCLEHAKLWLCNSDQPIQPGSSITYAWLRERLSRILSSDYFTRTPEMKAPGDVAAAMGKFAASKVQLSGSAEAPSPAVAEDLPSHFENEDDNVENSDTISNPDTDSQKDEFDLSNANGDAKVFQQEQHRTVEGEAGQQDPDLKGQQHVPRRVYQNQRGGSRGGGSNGGRRGHANGRGGRGRGGEYQNGRGQYYDPEYYPRNYYATGRGGRNGNQPMHNQFGATDGGHLPADIELGASS
ncbi:hypothetical protein Taro_038795 [Colocasia esculenta]|uniref:Glycine-rich protein n=1 Tax=Colocasia esculenta TaxID=4460 RepID=A0A843WGW7_COLES|nr:hypothetical protein [Colocasia esculenta]